MKRILASCAILLMTLCSISAQKVVIAYTYAGKRNVPLPDPTYLTHINYAFAHVNDSFDGLRIENPKRLRKVAGLKRKKRDLKVILSVGGWGSGNFSEMAADSVLRQRFCDDCRRTVRKFKLDGIDIDWEYPGTSVAKISSSPNDTHNYTLLMRDLRAALGPDKILSQATVCAAKYIDFAAVEPYVSYTNAMTYDLGNPPYHNTPLYWSEYVNPGSMPAHDGIQAHLSCGIPPEKLVMGLAFYGHRSKGFPRKVHISRAHLLDGYTYHWDEKAMVPYLTSDTTGKLVLGFENEKSLRTKCRYILEHGLLGAMFWSYEGDTPEGDFRKEVYTTLNPE